MFSSRGGAAQSYRTGRRGRDAVAERSCLGGITEQTWLDIQPRGRLPAQLSPPRERTKGQLLHHPYVPRLRRRPEHGVTAAKEKVPETLGQAAARQEAAELRKRLTNAIPFASQLSARELKEALTHWKASEPEWEAAARKNFVHKGYEGSEARKKVRRARAAEERTQIAAAAARSFRTSSIQYFAQVAKDVTRGTHSAVEEEESTQCGEKDSSTTMTVSLSNAQQGKLMLRAITLRVLYLQQNDDVDRKSALNIAAETAMTTAETVDKWEKDFVLKGYIKISQQGRYERRFVLTLDEGILAEIKTWTRTNGGRLKGEANKTVEDFRQYINNTIMPKLAKLKTGTFDPFKGLGFNKVGEGDAQLPCICHDTAAVWLRKLGCTYNNGQSGLCYDGHDREDVLEYRVETYLPLCFKYRDCMDLWVLLSPDEAKTWWIDLEDVSTADRNADGNIWICVDNLETPLDGLPEHFKSAVTSKKVFEDGKRAKMLTQDESTFRGNDCQRGAWWAPDMHGLKKKREGPGIMVSGTIVTSEGFVAATADQILQAEKNRSDRCAASTAAASTSQGLLKAEKYRPLDMLYKDANGSTWSFHLLEYGKNKDGYWTDPKMMNHMSDILDMMGVVYHDHKPVCAFNWSSCHDCLEAGAPSVAKMNLGYGRVRDGADLPAMDAVKLLEATPKLPVGAVQHLVFQPGDDPPFYAPHVEPKDYVGKVKGMRQILGEMGLLVPGMTKVGGKGDKMDLKKSMRHVLSEQRDFKEVVSSLQTLVERHGGICLMLPKYHCELNPIELVWGRAKFWARRVCDYSLHGLRKNVPLSLMEAEDRQARWLVQQYWRKTYTYHVVYHKTGAVGLQGDKAYEKYKSHRRPAPSEYLLSAVHEIN